MAIAFLVNKGLVLCGISFSPKIDAKTDTFRAIQKAYDILSDPDKRRDYDSQDAPKDEKYPTGKEQKKKRMREN